MRDMLSKGRAAYQREKPKQSDIEWRSKLPESLFIANLLPGHIKDVPDFWTADQWHETPAESAELERFLDDHFPRDKKDFAEFRRYIDKPPFPPVALRMALDPKPSKILTYRMLIENRREWRAAAHNNQLIAVMTGQTLPLGPRICEFCQLLFVARRKDQLTCDDTCASGRRMRRARAKAKAKEYELNRQRKKAAREYQLMLVRKENEREKQRKAR